jgi:uncharacterized membrane protein
MPDTAMGPGMAKCRLARVLAVVFVLLTAALGLAWSHSKLMSQDEIYAFQTYSVPTVGKLVQVQRTWPISLDPLLYPLLAHAGMKVFGVGAFAQRFPSLVGFLLMQVCLFFFVRSLAGARAGAVAVAFPALTATLFYSAEGRPYGLMLGLYALALLSWQVATRETGNREQGTGNRHRGWALVGLAAAIAATINAHYFGILLLVPVCAAEGFRTLQRRRIDWPVVVAIAAGMGSFVATWPFLKAANEFRKNYYTGGSVNFHAITRAYRWMFDDSARMYVSGQRLWMVVLVLLAVWLVRGCARQILKCEMRIPAAEWVLLITLAALPFFGYFLAKFVTHTIEVRYVLGAVVGISVMVGIAVSPWLRRDWIFVAVMSMLFLCILGLGVLRIYVEQKSTSVKLASMVLPPDVKAALHANPDGRLFIQDMSVFEECSIYEPDPDVKARLTLVYSTAEELRWNRHDTMALTAMHMQHFTGLPIVAYEDLRTQPGEHVFLLFHTGWDWTDQAFAADGARVRPVGKAMAGDVAGMGFFRPETIANAKKTMGGDVAAVEFKRGE